MCWPQHSTSSPCPSLGLLNFTSFSPKKANSITIPFTRGGHSSGDDSSGENTCYWQLMSTWLRKDSQQWLGKESRLAYSQVSKTSCFCACDLEHQGSVKRELRPAPTAHQHLPFSGQLTHGLTSCDDTWLVKITLQEAQDELQWPQTMTHGRIKSWGQRTETWFVTRAQWRQDIPGASIMAYHLPIYDLKTAQ